jgi:hypothetical protein
VTLTGRSVDEVLDETIGLVIASRNQGERVVARLTKTLQEALAEANDEQLTRATEEWAQTEEFWGHGDPVVLRPQVDALAAIARAASQRGFHLYCWVCV